MCKHKNWLPTGSDATLIFFFPFFDSLCALPVSFCLFKGILGVNAGLHPLYLFDFLSESKSQINQNYKV